MTFFKTLPNCRPSLTLFILIIRVILIITATINLCALCAAFQIFSPNSPNYGLYNFQDSPQFALNAFLFLAVLYTFLGNSQWSRRIRITAGLILLACNASLVGYQFKDIIKNGGCEQGLVFNTLTGNGTKSSSSLPLRLRCFIQMVIGSIGITWSVFLGVELILTDLYRKREGDQKLNSGYEECEEQQPGMTRPMSPAIVHLYQPNLSLNDSIDTRTETSSRTGESLEMEALPVYEQRPSGPRAHIIDLANVRHISRPARGTSMGPLRGPAPVIIQSPPPSYQAAHL